MPQASNPAIARAAPKQAESIAPSIAILPLREPPRIIAGAIIHKAPGSTEIAAVDDGSACGLDKIKSAIDTGKLPPDLVASARKVLEKVTAQLQASSIERERALGLYVQSTQRGYAAFDQQMDTQSDCPRDEACIAKARALREQAALPHVEALAQLAATAVDPASYAAAFYRCSRSTVRACASITAANWAAMDPGNAVPWLHVAIAADAQNDPVGRDEALRRASVLPVYDTRFPPMLRLSQADTVLAQPVPMRLAITFELNNNYADTSLSSASQILRFCAPPEDAVPGRVEVCSQLADKILRQDGQFIGRMVAQGLAEYARWPADQIATLKDEYDAMVQTMRTGDSFPTSQTNCSGYEKFNQLMSEMAHVGEVAMLRQRIGASGKTIAALAEERRVAVKKQGEDYAKANAGK